MSSSYYPSGKTPISLADLLVTWHSLATYAMGEIRRWKVPFDEMLRQGVLLYFDDGRPIYITMPLANRTF